MTAPCGCAPAGDVAAAPPGDPSLPILLVAGAGVTLLLLVAGRSGGRGRTRDEEGEWFERTGWTGAGSHYPSALSENPNWSRGSGADDNYYSRTWSMKDKPVSREVDPADYARPTGSQASGVWTGRSWFRGTYRQRRAAKRAA